MQDPVRQQVFDHSLRIAELVQPLLVSISRKDPDLARQVRRATSSITLNVAEGFGLARGSSRVRFETALGSLYETRAGLRLAIAWRFVTAADATTALDALDTLGRRIYGLSRR